MFRGDSEPALCSGSAGCAPRPLPRQRRLQEPPGPQGALHEAPTGSTRAVRLRSAGLRWIRLRSAAFGWAALDSAAFRWAHSRE